MKDAKGSGNQRTATVPAGKSGRTYSIAYPKATRARGLILGRPHTGCQDRARAAPRSTSSRSCSSPRSRHGERPMGRKPLTPAQRERRRASQKRWEEKHREERRAYLKVWRDDHREQRLAYSKQWRAENRDHIKAATTRPHAEGTEPAGGRVSGGTDLRAQASTEKRSRSAAVAPQKLVWREPAGTFQELCREGGVAPTHPVACKRSSAMKQHQDRVGPSTGDFRDTRYDGAIRTKLGDGLRERHESSVHISMSRNGPERGWLAADTSANEDEVYETLACPACTRINLVNRATGRVLGGDDE